MKSDKIYRSDVDLISEEREEIFFEAFKLVKRKKTNKREEWEIPSSTYMWNKLQIVSRIIFFTLGFQDCCSQNLFTRCLQSHISCSRKNSRLPHGSYLRYRWLAFHHDLSVLWWVHTLPLQASCITNSLLQSPAIWDSSFSDRLSFCCCRIFPFNFPPNFFMKLN